MTWDFCTLTNPTARKPHVCDDCGQEIAAGTAYRKLQGKWDGRMMSYKSHPDCAACCEALANSANLLDGDGYPHPNNFEPEDWDWLATNMPDQSARLHHRRHL